MTGKLPPMARVRICEPHREVLHLLERTVSRLGHEAVPCAGDPGGAELLLVDADDERALALGQKLRAAEPTLPVVALSIYPPAAGTAGLAGAAHVLKPFTRAQLDRAIVSALEGTLPAWPTASAPTAPSAI